MPIEIPLALSVHNREAIEGLLDIVGTNEPALEVSRAEITCKFDDGQPTLNKWCILPSRNRSRVATVLSINAIKCDMGGSCCCNPVRPITATVVTIAMMRADYVMDQRKRLSAGEF